MKDIISRKRKELGLTQQQLAEKLGISDKVVSKWETGRCLPDTSILVPLADALGIGVGELLTSTDEARSETEQVSRLEINSAFKNTFIVTMALQAIASVLMIAGVLLRDKGYHSDLFALASYVFTVLSVFVEVAAIAFFLIARNNLSDKYCASIAADKKYINLLLLCTYPLFVIVAAVFLFFHGLTAAEWLITLLIAAFALLLPFAACFLWNLRRR